MGSAPRVDDVLDLVSLIGDDLAEVVEHLTGIGVQWLRENCFDCWAGAVEGGVDGCCVAHCASIVRISKGWNKREGE